MAFDKAQEKGIVILTNFNSKHPQTMEENGWSKIENLGLALLKPTKAT
ncbi:MAG: hypothetical protein R2828_33170 [Saprospiraceae bacterium]